MIVNPKLLLLLLHAPQKELARLGPVQWSHLSIKFHKKSTNRFKIKDRLIILISKPPLHLGGRGAG
jgi:hypothetical protein